MCGRFATKGKAREMAQQLGIEEVDLPERFNIAPTTMAVAVIADPAPRWTFLRWGLVPGWAKDISIGNKLINTRSETILQKPSFRSAFKRRRCLIPAVGYFEWRRAENVKQPYFHTFLDDRHMAMAGIWEHWQSPEGSEMESFSLITTSANEMASKVHHRMPVILDPVDWLTWLNHSTEDVSSQLPLLKPYRGDNFQLYKVSRDVNSVRNDRPDLIQPLPHTPDLFPGF